MSSSPERRLGKRDGLRYAITWLHRRAETMNDPRAKAVLNSGAFDLGNEIREGHIPPIPDAQDTEDSMPSKRLVPEQGEAELTDQIVRLTYVCENLRDAHSKALAEIATLTEQRDRAMAVVEAARLWTRYSTVVEQRLKEAVATFDTQSSPSLPESP